MTDPLPTPPPLPPPGYAPLWRDPRAIDAGHLRLLSIFHYVAAGLGFLVLGFLVLHYSIMNTVFANPQMWRQTGQNAPPFDPRAFFGLFKWFYLFMGIWTVAGMGLNVVSGWCIARRKARIFSLVVAAINCLKLPFGTVLGVFTLIVLSRPSVQQAYEETPPTAAPPAPAG